MYCTGNEYISLPEIENNGTVRSFNVLSMDVRGMIEFRATDGRFMEFSIFVDGERIGDEAFTLTLDHYWLVVLNAETFQVSVRVRLFAPVQSKGFLYSFDITNNDDCDHDVKIVLDGHWDETLHTVNVSRRFEGTCNVYTSSWSHVPCFDIRVGFPVLSFAAETTLPAVWTSDDGIRFSCTRNTDIPAGESEQFSIVWGVGFEEVSAVTAAREIIRQKIDHVYNLTVRYLESVIQKGGSEGFMETLNRNLLFSIFYSTGRTVDTEELVCVTSRSPRYYVSAAYWDRDTLLWSFPAIVRADSSLAREILHYVSTRQRRNVGIHSRYIDGTVLEPGFELDELCAPVIAIDSYIRETGDDTILNDSDIISLVDRIISILDQKRNRSLGLYETFLQPTDDMRTYPYLTYDNVLVWKVFTILGSWNWKGMGNEYTALADDLKSDIRCRCIREYDGKMQYVWSVDESGNFDIYDEPPGSLVLLPFIGFISYDDEAWNSTFSQITDPSYEFSFHGRRFGAIGCPHAPHPWVLSLCNLVRARKDEDAVEKLMNAVMDDGIACESIDEDTGVSTTGDAFATCAGYLAASLMSLER